jgi:hypothetical protein
MQFSRIGRVVGALALMAALGGCVDVTMDVRVKNATEAVGTMTQTISAQFYPMIKASKSSEASGGSDNFCTKEDGGALVENADGSATCTITKEGKFADLGFDDGKEKVTFTSPGPGLVRVSFPTDEFQKGIDAAASAGKEAGAEDAQTKAAEDQMKAAMTAYFAGHFLTLKIEGGEITDSNMSIAPDKQSAEEKIAFTDIIAGTAKLPKELYAVVKVD